MLFCCSTFPVNSYLSKVCKKFVETVRGRLADANWSLLIRRCVPEMQMQCLQKANPVMKRTSGKKIARKTKETKKWCKTELETLEVVGYNSPKFNSSVNKQCWLKMQSLTTKLHALQDSKTALRQSSVKLSVNVIFLHLRRHMRTEF